MTHVRILLAVFVALFAAHAPSALAQTSKPVVRIGNLDIGPFVPVAYVAKLAEKHGSRSKSRISAASE